MLLDTGAGCCIIDMGTLKQFGLASQIEKLRSANKKCLDASGNEMDIIGKIKVSTSLMGTEQVFMQQFREFE